ncbi:FHA domain protein [Aspergillus fumigatus Af293]|uniref:FHA domain protein n=1 Tax=Aspergillus fumigatus (strain ATCC MYA-4609 / CBS 101355 / FGSC A1100 / Af293) TaxID=330879 RepID=Q4WVW6_ASPFU|nr:FHA domain protein [Aspergillus fumigatus Af293]EAL91260.1 FHA domain protein [Aspergillus fumigatus Af293]
MARMVGHRRLRRKSSKFSFLSLIPPFEDFSQSPNILLDTIVALVHLCANSCRVAMRLDLFGLALLCFYSICLAALPYMSASTVSASTSTANFPADSRSGPRRRLSQLRAYTQNHFSPHTSSSSANSQRSSRRHTFSSRVSWFSPSASSTSPESSSLPSTGTSHPTPCPTSDQSALARYSSVFFPSYRAVDVDLETRDLTTDSSQSTPSNDSGGENSVEAMARSGASSGATNARDHPRASSSSASANPIANTSESANSNVTQNSSSPGPKGKATIRFFPHQDPSQSSRPSLHFIPISRTLPSESSVIRVGRYSERDGMPVANPTEPSDAPVGFKSKVVSRKHCEFLYINGQWHIKDVGSSSGTFLNHMRLSQPNMVSRLYTIKDGDIVQLGIDFRGGEEMIFRCVRIRIECNRSWQQQPNEFNRLIHTPEYPMFQCPNCRAYTDLSAEVDDSNDANDVDTSKENDDSQEPAQTSAAETSNGIQEPSAESDTAAAPTQERTESSRQTRDVPADEGLADNIENMRLQDDSPSPSEAEAERTPNVASASPEPVVSNIASAPTTGSDASIPPSQPVAIRQARSNTPFRSESSDDNPLTPRNDSGPLAFDGRAGMP